MLGARGWIIDVSHHLCVAPSQFFKARCARLRVTLLIGQFRLSLNSPNTKFTLLQKWAKTMLLELYINYLKIGKSHVEKR